MAKKPKEQIPVLKDSDQPSLCVINGHTRLRVHEDFFVETELPKWKKFQENKKAFLKAIGADDMDSYSVSKKIKDAAGTDKVKEKELEAKLKKLHGMIRDDRWGIQEKHEREFNKAVENCDIIINFKPKTLRGKLAKLFTKKPKLVPVDVAFADLKDHMMLTSTETLSEAKAAVDQLAARYAAAGQYAKASKIKELTPRIVEELTLAHEGFTTYVTENQMINFIKKSERGVMVNFLRYYEGDIPEDVLKKKQEADEKMVFDNYVVAYYVDIKKEAKVVKAKEAKKSEEKARERRRDPILFGIIKQSRNLYYIADWVTPDDDLTLKKLEKVLGDEAYKLADLLGGKAAKKGTTILGPTDEDGSDDRGDVVEASEIVRQAIQRNLYQRDAESTMYSSFNTPTTFTYTSEAIPEPFANGTLTAPR